MSTTTPIILCVRALATGELNIYMISGGCACVKSLAAARIYSLALRYSDARVDMKFRMMVVAAVAVMATVVTGCGGDDENSFSEGSGGGMTVSLETQEDSGISGDATFGDKGGKSSVKLTLDGTEDGKAYAAHVHEGTCDELDPTPAYPLEDAKDGSSTSTIDVKSSVLEESDYAVNVHNADDPKKYVACGNIEG